MYKCFQREQKTLWGPQGHWNLMPWALKCFSSLSWLLLSLCHWVPQLIPNCLFTTYPACGPSWLLQILNAKSPPVFLLLAASTSFYMFLKGNLRRGPLMTQHAESVGWAGFGSYVHDWANQTWAVLGFTCDYSWWLKAALCMAYRRKEWKAGVHASADIHGLCFFSFVCNSVQTGAGQES